MSLQVYNTKRDFKKTLEPKGLKVKTGEKLLFVVQKHAASHLHYDFRLELDGVLKSWAVPKGPSLDPKTKRLAVEVEDHPIDYSDFEGEIPAKEYGGGHVIVWDTGEWIPPENALAQLKKGQLEFELKGHKLQGRWVLVRTSRGSTKKPTWLLIKRTDQHASTKKDVTANERSVLTGRTIEMVKDGRPGQRLKAKKKSAQNKSIKLKESKLFELKEPQLAFLVDEPPTGDQWVHEIKFDGYRTLAEKNKKKLKLKSRGGHDWSAKYPEIYDDCLKIKADSFLIDGEVAWIDEKGHSQFSGLQNALESKKTSGLVYYVFDLLYLNGVDLRQAPLGERKKVLEALVKKTKSSRIVYSTHWATDGADVFKKACEHQLEGIISKNKEAPYESGRSKNWLKIKCTNVQEFLIGGYTLQQNGSLAALLMGAYNDQQKLQYIGRVGTGYSQQTSSALLEKLKKISSNESKFEIKSPHEKNIRWVRPNLIANIEFATWTDDEILRHAAFKGLRTDQKPKNVFLKEKTFPEATKKELSAPKIKLTHPDKILFPTAQVTKLELAEYYTSIKDWIMPFVENRPLALLRCPSGEGKTCFFQKHIKSEGDGLLTTTVTSKLEKKKEDIIYIDNHIGLMAMVQLSNLEIHARGCQRDNIDYADLIVFDLDPDPDVTFEQVKKAAYTLRDMLKKLGLKAFVKTTGGKGLHVQAPILPLYSWDEIKNFTRSVCEQLVKQHPESYTTNILKSKRKEKIFLDYLRNGYGATAAVAYTVRAKPNASVAFPVTWAELKKLNSADQFTLRDVQKLLVKRKDPWKDYFKIKQRIKVLDQAKKR